MAEHEPCVGASDDWYTPPEMLSAIGLTFDLDPCSPGAGHWVPARRVYTKADDGLSQPWAGLVFMNPPFGGREGHIPRRGVINLIATRNLKETQHADR